MAPQHSISIVCVALLLSGCTMMPKYQRPAAPVAAQYPGMTATNKADAADVARTNFFEDERLKKLIELALANNRDMRVAILNVEESRAEYRVTRSASFPTVDGSGGYTRSGNFSTASDSWSASLGTTAYQVDLFGRVRSLNRQALEKYFATDEARRSEQISLVASVATEYFTLRETEQLLELSRQTLQAVQESYDLNKAMFDAGASSALDLRESEGQVPNGENQCDDLRAPEGASGKLSDVAGRPAIAAGFARTTSFHGHKFAGGNSGGFAVRIVGATTGHLGSRTHAEGR